VRRRINKERKRETKKINAKDNILGIELMGLGSSNRKLL
jgi:hypothetical protein